MAILRVALSGRANMLRSGGISLEFDPSKPFYPLVVNYLTFLWGFKELSAQGVAAIWRQLKDNNPTNLSDEALKAMAAYSARQIAPDQASIIERILDSKHIELLDPLRLAVNAQSDPIEVSAGSVAAELTRKPLGEPVMYGMRSAGSLLILAYETTPAFHDKGPLWEFLRHCRNAAAHNGRWHFKNREPARPAVWRSIRLDRSMNGSALFRIGTEPGTLQPGDPLLLLWDIEQAYPNMTA